MPGLYAINTRDDGTVLTAAIYMADHQVHVDNLSFNMIGITYTDAAYDAVTDGQSGGSRSKPTHLQGQLEKLAFAVKQIKVLLSPAITNWWETISSLTGNGSGLTGIVISDTITNVTEATTALTDADCTGRKEYTNWNSAVINNFPLPAAAANLKVRLRVTTGSATVGMKWTCAGAENAIIGNTTLTNCTSNTAGSIWELACEQNGASSYTWRARLVGVQPTIQAYNAADQPITATNLTQVNFNTELIDNNFNFTANVGTLTIPGLYEINWEASIYGAVVTNEVDYRLYKNGSSYSDPYIALVSNSALCQHVKSSFDAEWVAVGDYYEVKILTTQNSTITGSYIKSTKFSIIRKPD